MENSAKEARSRRPVRYRIVVEGKLRLDWSDWLSGMEIVTRKSGSGRPVTTLTGLLVDQAALRGVLCKVWDLNLTVLSVSRLEQGAGKKDRE